MDSKQSNIAEYYVPEIEEFRVGFEYEIEGRINEWIKKVWYIHDFSEGRFRANLTYGESIRVKCLDRADIESCNWIYTGRSVDIWFQKEGDFEMSSWTAYKVIMHYGLHDQRLHVYAVDPGSPDNTLFRGIVKNKSEFQKVMKMINIT